MLSYSWWVNVSPEQLHPNRTGQTRQEHQEQCNVDDRIKALFYYRPPLHYAPAFFSTFSEVLRSTNIYKT
jgi:hypothetical protein